MDTRIDEYFGYLEKVKRASQNTIDSYKRDVRKYAEHLESENMGSVCEVTSTVILNYLMKLQKQGKSAATASRSLASIRSLYKYLQQKGYVPDDPTFELHSFKANRRPPRALSDAQVEMLLDTPVCRNIKGYRDRAMLEIMYATGMRASDLINISVDDVNLKVGYIYTRSGGKERVIPIYAYARDCLQEYMEKRSGIRGSENTNILFLNLNGSPLTRQGLWKIFKTYQKKLGLSVEITPHTLRHSFAIHLLENGADLKSVQELMGHSDISSTQIYEQVVKNRLTEVYEKSHPRSKHRR